MTFLARLLSYSTSCMLTPKQTFSESERHTCRHCVIFMLQEKEMELDSEREKTRRELEGNRKKLQVNFNIMTTFLFR